MPRLVGSACSSYHEFKAFSEKINQFLAQCLLGAAALPRHDCVPSPTLILRIYSFWVSSYYLAANFLSFASFALEIFPLYRAFTNTRAVRPAARSKP